MTRAMPDQSDREGACHVAILQPGYLPWLGYFDLLASADQFVLYDDVQFDKRSWRNRNRILLQGNPFWLTVPVLQKSRMQQLIKDTEIDGNRWIRKHLNSIRHAYRDAPYLDWCYPAIENWLLQRSYTMLLDLCLEGHETFCGLLGLNTSVQLSSEIGFQGVGRTERLVAICGALRATRYISCDASASYMKEDLWKERGIELTYQNYHHPVYAQSANDFVSHLSTMDALMFLGPGTRELLRTKE